MDDHLDVHTDDFPLALPMRGKVTGVYPQDHVQNPTGESTIYQVEVYPQRPPVTIVTLPFVPALGQLGGGANDQEDPYLKGDMVLVGFVEGDPNLPYIMGRLPDLGEAVSSLAETQGQHPRVAWKRNGLAVAVSKDGDAVVNLAADKSLTITDSAGNALLQIIKSGGSYEVRLGGDTGLKALMTEDVIGIFNAHTHLVTGVQAGAGSVTSNSPSSSLGSSEKTSVTKAK